MTSETSRRTIAHYDGRADIFWQGTKDHDVEQNVQALLCALLEHRAESAAQGFRVLDFGCGPGRDLKRFADLGHRPVGLDGAQHFVSMAQSHSGCEVWHQDFLNLQLPAQHFDGIFANASLFHVPERHLPDVLKALHHSLHDCGILFASNPRGNDEEHWYGERYGRYHSLEGWRDFMTGAGFSELQHYYRPQGLPREQQPWLASVWRREGSGL